MKKPKRVACWPRASQAQRHRAVEDRSHHEGPPSAGAWEASRRQSWRLGGTSHLGHRSMGFGPCPGGPMWPRKDWKPGMIQSVLEYRMVSVVATCQGASGAGGSTAGRENRMFCCSWQEMRRAPSPGRWLWIRGEGGDCRRFLGHRVNRAG